MKGDAILGQDTCTGLPWPHALAAGVTTGLYAATFTVSLMMPDPDDLANTKGAFGDTLRMHKLLRWVHFGGMLAQIALGSVIATGDSFGPSPSPHGRIGAWRSTPGWHSHDFADAIIRDAIRAPWLRASSPTTGA